MPRCTISSPNSLAKTLSRIQIVCQKAIQNTNTIWYYLWKVTQKSQKSGVLGTQNHEAIPKNALKLGILGLHVVPASWIAGRASESTTMVKLKMSAMRSLFACRRIMNGLESSPHGRLGCATTGSSISISWMCAVMLGKGTRAVRIITNMLMQVLAVCWLSGGCVLIDWWLCVD